MSARVYDRPSPTELGRRAARAAADTKLLAGRPSGAAARARAGASGFASLIPRQNIDDWTPRLGSTALDTLRTVRDRDPDASQAVMNLLLLMGQGYRVEMEDQQGKPHQEAQADAQAWDAQVGSDYGGGMDALVSVLGLTLATQGALAGELELTKDLRDVLDLHPLDPARFTFKRDGDGRLQRGVFVGKGKLGADPDGMIVFNPNQVRYVPLHPDVDDPYGRSPILAALTAIFFKIQLLEDLKAVVHNQGYPRLDIKVVQNMVLDAIPAHLKVPGKEGEQAAFVSSFLVELQAQYSALEPDDTFIHWDSVVVDYVGPSGSGGVNIDTLMNVLDTQIVNGLKHVKILLNRNEGSTTTHASIQWRAYALFVNGMQRVLKRVLEWAHTTRAQIKGYVGVHAKVTFDALPTTDHIAESQAFGSKVQGWIAAIDAGLATRDEAAQDLFGHGAVAIPPAQQTDTTDRVLRRQRMQARAHGSLAGVHHRAPADRVTSADIVALLDEDDVLDGALKLLTVAEGATA